MKRGFLVLATVLCLASCAREEPLIVYCEPQMSSQAEEWLAAFRQQSGVQTQLISLSSEVTAQHIRYRQPIDVWIFADPQLPTRFEIEDRILTTRVLADDSVVKVQCVHSEQAVPFKSQNCWARAASDTPLEHYTTDWISSSQVDASDSCTVVANFHAQLSDYLVRGWVRGGYVWASFAAQHPDQLKVIHSGPRIVSAWQVSQVKTGRNPLAAKRFVEGLPLP